MVIGPPGVLSVLVEGTVCTDGCGGKVVTGEAACKMAAPLARERIGAVAAAAPGSFVAVAAAAGATLGEATAALLTEVVGDAVTMVVVASRVAVSVARLKSKFSGMYLRT